MESNTGKASVEQVLTHYIIAFWYQKEKKTFLTQNPLFPELFTCNGLPLWCSVLSCQIKCISISEIHVLSDLVSGVESRLFTAFKVKIQQTFHLNFNSGLFSQ